MLADMTVCEKDGFLHLIGENDWGYLLAHALAPLINYGRQVEIEVFRKLLDFQGVPEVISLGKNEFRAVDILHIIREPGKKLTEIDHIPVVESTKTNGISIYGDRKAAKEVNYDWDI